jgi:hypothetical protein
MNKNTLILIEYQPIFEIPPYATNIRIKRFRDREIMNIVGNDGYIGILTFKREFYE